MDGKWTSPCWTSVPWSCHSVVHSSISGAFACPLDSKHKAPQQNIQHLYNIDIRCLTIWTMVPIHANIFCKPSLLLKVYFFRYLFKIDHCIFQGGGGCNRNAFVIVSFQDINDINCRAYVSRISHKMRAKNQYNRELWNAFIFFKKKG